MATDSTKLDFTVFNEKWRFRDGTLHIYGAGVELVPFVAFRIYQWLTRPPSGPHRGQRAYLRECTLYFACSSSDG